MFASIFRSSFWSRSAVKPFAPLASIAAFCLVAGMGELNAAPSCAPGEPIRAIKTTILSSGAPTISGSSTLSSYPTSYSSSGQAEQFYPSEYATYKASLTPAGTRTDGRILYLCNVKAEHTYLPPFCDTDCRPSPLPVALSVSSHAGYVYDGNIIDLPPNTVCDAVVVIFHGLQDNQNGQGRFKTPGNALDTTAQIEASCPGDYDIFLTYTDNSTNETGQVQLDQVHTETGEFSYKTGVAFAAGTGPFTKDSTTYTLNSVFAQASCPAGDPAGSGGSLGSVRFWMNLGRTTADRSAGAIRLDADSFTSAIYSPRALFVPKSLEGVVVVYNGAVPRQVKAPQTFADIVIIDSSTYEVRFYAPAYVGAPDGTTGIFALSGAPYAVYKFENPDAAIPETKRLRVTETRGASTKVTEFGYDAATSTWTFSQGNGLRQESSITTFVSGDRVKTITVKNDTSQVSSKTKRTYHRFAWGEELIREVLDPDGAALTTDFEFYNTTTSDPNYGHLKQRTNPDGSWFRYTYDADGHTLKTIQPFLDADPTTTDESLCRVVEKTYDTLVDSDGDGTPEKRIRTIERTLGTETARSYRVDWSKPVILSGDSCTRRSDIVCTVSGAAWDASSNLVTETLRYAGGNFIERARRVVRPDGTATIASYTIDGYLIETATMKSGQPNSGLTDIVDGTRTLTTTSSSGQVTGETVTDIASSLELSSWIATAFDSVRRPTYLDYTDDTYITRSYACCGLESERDRLGVTTTMEYDELGRRTAVARDGISMRTGYDADGRVKTVTRRGTDDSTITQETNTYDLAGRLTERKDARNRATGFAESFSPSTGHLTRTTTNPDSGTVVEVFARDGSRLAISGSAAAPHNFEYGIDTDGMFVKNIAVGESGGSPTTTEWTKAYIDFAGRPYKAVFADSATIQSYFNGAGQLIRQVDPDGIATLFAYNLRGELEVTAIDVNANGSIDYAGTDRITKMTRTFASKTDGGTYTVGRATTQIWETNGADTPISVSIAEQSVDGLRTWQTIRGLTTRSVAVPDGSGGVIITTTTPDGVKTIRSFQADRLLSHAVKTAANAPIVATTYDHDTHHRVQSVSDARNGVTTFAYFADDQIQSVTTPDPDSGKSGTGYDPQTTSYTYNSTGRLESVTQPDGGVVNTTYYLTGAVKRTWGSRTYPVEYTYDPQGRVKTLTTWQNFAGDSGKAVTTWNYDSQRGFLLNKRYNDSTGPNYTYKPSGRLLTRVWARTPTITTTYGYNGAGDLSVTDYSETTPDVAVTYDRIGRPVTITDASGARTLSYHNSGQLQGETYTSGALNGLSVGRSFDSSYRLSGINVPSVVTAGYTYDDASRLHSVTRGSNTATYAYATDSNLVSSITFTEGATTRLTTAKEYDKLNRLASITNTIAGPLVSSHTYTYNSANQRTRAKREDNAYWSYSYDSLGQVTNGSKFLGTDLAVPGFAYGYTYDDIGNRKTTVANGQTSTYTPTLLNNYSQRTVPGTIDVSGAAAVGTTVTISVNGGTPQTTERNDEIFYKQLSTDNSAAGQAPLLTIVAIKNGVGPAGEDEKEQFTKTPYLAKTPELFTYDTDGNLIDDARWHYTWDGENRLIAMETSTLASAAGVPKQKLEFAYDSMGRRFQKKTYSWNSGTSTYDLSANTRFLYDGWNLLSDLNGQSANAVLCTYVWGLDLTGSLQGAGGVGGLLFSTLGGNTANHAYTYDGNGNVSTLVNMTSGVRVASYDYDSFGRSIVIEGAIAAPNPFRFSTKYTDDESEYIYYGYRFYSPNYGRWISRDPISENGGVSLYTFVYNSSINRSDFIGLDDIADYIESLDPKNSDALKEIRRASAAGTAIVNGTFHAGVETVKFAGELAMWETGARTVSVVYKGGMAIRLLSNGERQLLSKSVAEKILAEEAAALARLKKQAALIAKVEKGEAASCEIGTLVKEGGGSQKFYRAMSDAEYKKLLESRGLSLRPDGSSQLFVTQDLKYMRDLPARPGQAGKYSNVVEFTVDGGTQQRLLDFGATHNSTSALFPDLPSFSSGMDAVQIKLEAQGVISYGLGSSTQGLEIFNSSIQTFKLIEP